jgi:hypothetical protein
MSAPTPPLEESRAALRALNLQTLAEPEPPAPLAPPPSARAEARRAFGKLLWQGRPWPALQTVALLLSLAVNIVLLVAAGVLLMLAGRAFELRDAVAAPLLNGLHDGFVAMDAAHIRTTIAVNDTITVDDTLPVEFDLPVQASTVVTLTQPVLITGASVNISGGILTLNDAPATILLPANTPLPVELNLVVPVRQTVPVRLTVPVKLSVPVDIPLAATDLHGPFTSLRDLFAPYKSLVNDLPGSWNEAICRGNQALCGLAQ